jgi:hypothetical protein
MRCRRDLPDRDRRQFQQKGATVSRLEAACHMIETGPGATGTIAAMRRALLVILPWAALAGGAIASPAGAQSPSAVELVLVLDSAAIRGGSARGLATKPPEQPRVHIADMRPAPVRAAGQRDPSVSEQHLVVRVIDGTGQELSRATVIDPRLVRGETTDASGRLVSTRLWRTVGSLRVVVPAAPPGATVRVYQPRWNGRRMALDLLASTPLR